MALRKWNAIKIVLITLRGTLGCLLTIRDAGSKGTAPHKVLGLEFPQLISGMEKGNFIPKKKKSGKATDVNLYFKHQKN